MKKEVRAFIRHSNNLNELFFKQTLKYLNFALDRSVIEAIETVYLKFVNRVVLYVFTIAPNVCFKVLNYFYIRGLISRIYVPLIN